MKKTVFIMLTALLSAVSALAGDFKTNGNGTTWTLSKLADTVGSGVTKEGQTFTMANNVEIAAGDRFEIESGIKVLMADGVQLRISCEAKFDAGERVVFTAADETAKPYGIFVDNDHSTTSFSNIDFEYAGLKNFGTYGLDVSGCTFKRHNGVSGSSALGLGTSGAAFNVSDCIFEECMRSGIGGAANYANPITLENCVFKGNGTSNLNTPQINLTTAGNVTVRNCRITGNPAYNMVGGIVVSNLIGMTGDMNTIIESNEIRDCRFGVAVYCEQKAIIRNNLLINNKYETNPNNGGSGINIYDPQMTQTTMITGNHIEGNLWGVTVIGGKNINLGKTEDKDAEDYNPGMNVFLNNSNSGSAYDLYNNSTKTVYAQGNYWKSVDKQDRESIETVIFHKNDDQRLGEVIFMPALNEDPADIGGIAATGKIGKVSVYSLNGIKIAETDGKDFSGLRPGIYTVRMATDKGIITRNIAIKGR
ncbi:NosD domain-containing protein [Xylanibacter muris]|uniref:Periplasmic copper-binding protein NosD beta helix domain-containing protein n=1 Tax=Xylanibacter muris TaxID=2736290 RepID=A0ABX2AJ44_9BACT|nr:NosD domain-containing protein [Xylanibacter muris]NPD91129.1 hypothetical protein [Xylanibacter muris]